MKGEHQKLSMSNCQSLCKHLLKVMIICSPYRQPLLFSKTRSQQPFQETHSDSLESTINRKNTLVNEAHLRVKIDAPTQQEQNVDEVIIRNLREELKRGQNERTRQQQDAEELIRNLRQQRQDADELIRKMRKELKRSQSDRTQQELATGKAVEEYIAVGGYELNTSFGSQDDLSEAESIKTNHNGASDKVMKESHTIVASAFDTCSGDEDGLSSNGSVQSDEKA